MNRALENIEPLSKNNFHKWKAQIQMSLMRNNSWEYVSGEKIRTTENATEWDIADRKARSDIIITVSPEALMKVNDCKTSKEVWDKLNDIYCISYSAYKSMLIKQLINCKMQEDEEMDNHIINFSTLISKLRKIHIFIQDDIASILLLNSVSNSYEDFKIAVETEEQFPSFEDMKIRLLQEDLRRIQNRRLQENQGVENNTNYSGSGIGHATNVCTYSGTVTKHTIQIVTPRISHQVLYQEIINILKDADYRTLTLKRVREVIEAKYNTNLNDRQTEIYFLVMQYIKANSFIRERLIVQENEILIEDTDDDTESGLDDEWLDEE
ncbi:uncharacterized protein LOC132909010 isoform X3 [Bombus pascuorum]|uniref:uncharacterized protein LOC132909010 isoform X3 n=1 Tax=Bombus pascuorum TaxID=65598 RepID=UPI0021237784|nr:uncharacterized protein LOC132909010 isoform X3 [Bombus pascuorum]